MFTGIVQDLGRVLGWRTRSGGRALRVGTGLDTATFAVGESVAVNGACLTVTALSDGEFDADVSPETLQRTNLGALGPGRSVNLERALRPVDRLGGHFVLGHVDATGRVRFRRAEGEFQRIGFEAPAAVARYLVEKGSVAVDGVSLTVADCSATEFSAAVIPLTLESTTLHGLRPGDVVNLEADLLGKYVEKLLGRQGGGGGLSLEILARGGYLK